MVCVMGRTQLVYIHSIMCDYDDDDDVNNDVVDGLQPFVKIIVAASLKLAYRQYTHIYMNDTR